MRTKEATARPWIAEQGGRHIHANRDICLIVGKFEDPEADANAELIVRAVNAHDELLAACKALMANQAGSMDLGKAAIAKATPLTPTP